MQRQGPRLASPITNGLRARVKRFPKGTLWYCYQTKGVREWETDVFYPDAAQVLMHSGAFLEQPGSP